MTRSDISTSLVGKTNKIISAQGIEKGKEAVAIKPADT